MDYMIVAHKTAIIFGNTSNIVVALILAMMTKELLQCFPVFGAVVELPRYFECNKPHFC